MALVIGNNVTVATGMSPIVENALYADQIFIDGQTFSSRYDIGNAGQIQVQVYRGGRGVKPHSPGGKLEQREYTNEVININCVNAYPDCLPVPQYFVNTLPSDVQMQAVYDVSMRTGNGRQESAMAALVHQATEIQLEEEITSENVEKIILDVREQVRKRWATPNIIMASVHTYNEMLKAAGTKFIPLFNDDTIRSGKVGMWMGYLWLDATLLDGTTKDYTYREVDGEDIVVDTSDVEFVMYDWQAFSIIDKLVGLRVINDPDRFGVLVQAEIDSGFKVTNKDQVYVARKNA